MRVKTGKDGFDKVKFFLRDEAEKLSAIISFVFFEKRWFVLGSKTVISKVKIKFIKNNDENSSNDTNILHINSISDANNISKKDYFGIHLKKQGKKFLKTLLCLIVCNYSYVVRYFLALDSFYNAYK